MLEPGTLLSSRYRIREILGRGGMGAVYLADAEALGGKKVAVKEMVPRGLAPDELDMAVEQFKREAMFLANLEHANLVSVSDFFVEDGKHYLVMAYIKGETLQQKLVKRGRPFQWFELCHWIERLTEVLNYLHGQDPPILFRDLKPANIMISDAGRLHLIDFGIARTAHSGTRTSTFLQGTGTQGFSPIEQYGSQQSTDQRSDIYSLGATVYYLLTGVLPPDAVERVTRRDKLNPPSRLEPGLPSNLDALVMRSMALSPEDRHQTMDEFRREMARVGQQPVPPRPSVPAVVFRGESSTDRITRPDKEGWKTLATALSGVAAASLMVFLVGAKTVGERQFSSQPEASVALSAASTVASLEPTELMGEWAPANPPFGGSEPSIPGGAAGRVDPGKGTGAGDGGRPESAPEPVSTLSTDRALPATANRPTLGNTGGEYPTAVRVPVRQPGFKKPVLSAPRVTSRPHDASSERAPVQTVTRPVSIRSGPVTPIMRTELPVEGILRAQETSTTSRAEESPLQASTNTDATVYQTETRWASRGQSNDITRSTPAGGRSMTSLTASTNSTRSRSEPNVHDPAGSPPRPPTGNSQNGSNAPPGNSAPRENRPAPNIGGSVAANSQDGGNNPASGNSRPPSNQPPPPRNDGTGSRNDTGGSGHGVSPPPPGNEGRQNGGEQPPPPPPVGALRSENTKD